MEKDLKEKIELFESTKSKQTMVFSKMGLLVITLLARKYCHHNLVYEQDHRFKLGRAFLIINDLLRHASFKLNNDEGKLNWNSFSMFSVRESLLSEEPILRLSISRAIVIYSLLKEKVPKEDRFDLDMVCLKSVSMT